MNTHISLFQNNVHMFLSAGLVNGKDSVAHRDVFIVIRNAPRSEFLEEVFFHGLAGPVFIIFYHCIFANNCGDVWHEKHLQEKPVSTMATQQNLLQAMSV